jgi:hypothetical protein
MTQQIAPLQAVPKGTIVERRFEIEVLERGYEVAMHSGGGKDFDYIVRLPGGRPVVVQVKTGVWDITRGCYQIENHSCGRIYSADAYDVLAVYLPDRKQWLLYTRAELGNRLKTTYNPPELRKRLRKTHCGMHGEMMADREPDNWDLLNDVAESLTFSGPTPANVPPHAVQMSNIP